MTQAFYLGVFPAFERNNLGAFIPFFSPCLPLFLVAGGTTPPRVNGFFPPLNHSPSSFKVGFYPPINRKSLGALVGVVSFPPIY